MYLYQNAVRNIFRNKGRYLLTGGMMAIMLVTATVCAMINATTKEVIQDYVSRFSARVYFTHDLRQVMKLKPGQNGMITVPEISTEQFLSFADSEHVKNTLFTGSIHAYSEDFEGLDQQQKSTEINDVFSPSIDPMPSDRQEPNCVVLGYSDLSMIEEFQLGLRTIDSGGMFEKQGECVISLDFANRNRFKVGDTLSLFNVDDTEHRLTLTISGIYLDATTEQANDAGLPVNNRRNQILTSYDTLTAERISAVHTTATYYLKTPESGAAFEKELREKGLPEVYNVNIDSDNYYQIVEPVRGLAKIAAMMLWIVLGLGCTILILLSFLSIRERKYEIGVLRAMGMEKGKVAAVMLMESFTVMTVCLLLGLGVGTAVAQPVSNSIMSHQLAIAQDVASSSWPDYGDGIVSSGIENEIDYQSLANVRVDVTPEMILWTTGIALALGLVSSSAGVWYVTRFEPIRILSERGA